MSYALIGMLVASLIGSVISAQLSYNSAQANIQSQEKINAENVKAQQDINAENVLAQKEINQQNIDYSKVFAQNQIQWKMQDLEAAGLNPTLAAGGVGGSYSPGVLSAPTQKAPYQHAPMLDMSGVSSAINAMSNFMLSSYLIDSRNNINNDRNDVMRENIATRHQDNNARNDVLRQLYKRKGIMLGRDHIASAKQINNVANENWSDDWDKLLDELKHGRFK